jgi:hypothetical protein
MCRISPGVDDLVRGHRLGDVPGHGEDVRIL